MYISLRKAAALQQEILAAVPALKTSAEVSIFEALPAAVISQAAIDLTKAMELRSSLMDALYEIRDAVAAANVSAGIHALVSRRARIEKDIAVLNTVSASLARPADSVILAKVERQRNSDSNHYSYSETVNFNVLPQASLDSVKATVASLKKEKVAIQDQLLELNIKTNIKLSEGTVSTLSAADLI